MARSVEKNTRCYVDGFDLSGYGRSVGPLEQVFDEADMTAWTHSVKGFLPNQCHANVGTLNVILDDTATTGSHAVLGTAGQERVVTVARGMTAAPSLGSIAFGGQFVQKAYTATQEGGAVTATIPFEGWAVDASTLNYGCPFGVILHASGQEVGVNAANGTDYPRAGATSGGYMVVHILALDAGTVTIKVQDAAIEAGPYADVGGLTTGAIGVASVPYAAVVATTLPTTAIRQYARWQLVFAGGAAACTFVLSLHRK